MSSCSLRTLSELSPANLVNVTGEGGVVYFSYVAPYVPTEYVPLPCGKSQVVVTPLSQGSPIKVDIPLTDGTSSHYSLLILQGKEASDINPLVLVDVDAQISGIDSATLRVISAFTTPVDIFGVVDECYDCALPKLNGKSPLSPGDFYTLSPMDTKYPWSFRAWDASAGQVVVPSLPSNVPESHPLQRFSMQEHGSYTLLLHPNGASSFLEDAAGRNADLPLLFYFLGMVVLGVVHRVVGGMLASQARLTGKAPKPRKPREVTCLAFWGYDKLMEAAATEGKVEEEGEDGLTTQFLGPGEGSLQQSSVSVKDPPPSSRVLSLDTFRGFALCVMMLANFGGGRYSYLDHSRWNGLTVADLLFPWFVFMSGVSAALSHASEARKGTGAWERVGKTVVRSGKLL